MTQVLLYKIIQKVYFKVRHQTVSFFCILFNIFATFGYITVIGGYMNLFFFLYILSSVAYLVLGIITIMNNRRENINRNFLSICLNLSFWAFMHGLVQLSKNPEIVSHYRQIMIFSWSSLYVQILYFSMFLTQNKRFYDKLWKNIIIMFIPVSVYVYYMINSTGANDLVHTGLGWIFTLPSDRGLFWDHFFNFYYLLYMLLSILIIFMWKKHSDSQREKKQASIILKSFFLVLLIGSIIDVLLPMVGIKALPPLAVILIIGVMAAISYTIIKYKLMDITPQGIMKDIYKTMHEGILIVDSSNTIIDINNSVSEMTGYKPSEVKGKSLMDYFDLPESDHEFSSLELKLLDKHKKVIYVLMTKNFYYDQFGKIIGTVYTFQDMTTLKDIQGQLEMAREKLEEKVYQRTLELSLKNDELLEEVFLRKEKEEEINQLIHSDYLTKLPNRRYLYNRLKQSIQMSIREKTKIAILFMDLDDFKHINDTMGHDAGDSLLIKVGQKLKSVLRKDDCVCRVGGDEFIILIEDIEELSLIEKVVGKILGVFKDAYMIHDIPLYVNASIGISIYPDDSDNINTIVENADIAMYKVKEAQKNNYMYYESSMRKGMAEMMNLSNELYEAIKKEEFELYYQPQIDSYTGKLIGFEALIRWNHERLGLIYPGRFIHLCEKNGLIIALGEWIMESCFKQMTKWLPYVEDEFSIGINLSANQLIHPDFSKKLEQLFDIYSIPGHMIEFEITEGILVNKSINVTNNLKAIRSGGYSLAIDDFGTEYASLSYLKHLDIDRLKIPKAFVDGVGKHPSDEAIITSIITLAHKLGCRVIAEGVETIEQLLFLQEHDCHNIQGYYYFEALDVEEVEKLFFENIKYK